MEAYSDPSGYVEPVALYSENDPFAAAWLRELIKANLIAPGVVDERSIEDIKPDELAQYTQCHFFAGIGGWSLALRLAGWPDDRPVWTGSCPCQPFSTAGKKSGTSDERHLWPAFFHLIEQCKPAVVFGEQVEAAIRQGWLDLVQNDMEGIGYAFAAAGLPAASVGAPHLRARLYFVGDSNNTRSQGRGISGDSPDQLFIGKTGLVSALAYSSSIRQLGRGKCDGSPSKLSETFGSDKGEQTSELGAPSGFWSDAEWVKCLDGRQRPIEPGTFPLAHGASKRVGKLRGYGNAIVPPLAQAFIESYLDTRLAGA